MRNIRSYVVGAVAGAALTLTGVVGGIALADIPDSQPSVVDPSHTLYGCWRDSASPTKQFFLLDKSEGNCPASYPHEVQFAPVVPQTP